MIYLYSIMYFFIGEDTTQEITRECWRLPTQLI